MTFVVISYKSNVTNYCRSCVMERFDSKFHIETFVDDVTAIDYIVKLDQGLDKMDGEYQHYRISMEDFIPPRDPDGGWYWDAPSILSMNNDSGNLPDDWKAAIAAKKNTNTTV